MVLTWEVLEVPVRENRTPVVLSLCSRASESERRGCAKPVMALLRAQLEHWKVDDDALLVAALACCSLAQLRKRVVEFSGIGTAAAYEALADRAPPWLGELAEAILDHEHYGGQGWPLVRALVRDGRIERPTHPEYVGKMVSGIRGRLDAVEGRSANWSDNSRAPVYDRVLLDPGLLDHELWSLFTSESAARRLCGYEESADPAVGWSGALLKLSAAGSIERLAVLEGCLNAFLSDIAATRLGWYAKLWKSMSPTLDEQASLLPQLYRVLATDASIGVAMALEALSKLQRASRLPSDDLPEVLPPALQRAEKGNVTTAIGLVRRSDLAPDAAIGLVSNALGHVRTDVQELALDLVIALAAGASPAALADLSEAVEAVSPSLVRKASVVRDAGGTDRPAEPLSTDDVVLRSLDGVSPAVIDRLALNGAMQLARDGVPPSALPPDVTASLGPAMPPRVATFDELIDVLVELLEEADSPLRIELALDGLVRLSGRAAPAALVARARTRMQEWPGAFRGGDPRADIAAVIVAWGDRRPWAAPHRSFDRPSVTQPVTADETFWGQPWAGDAQPILSGFIAARFWDAARNTAREEVGTSLACPTRAQGWIEADILVERLAELERTRASASDIDITQAILRLALPSEHHGHDLLNAVQRFNSDAATAFRSALGDRSARVRSPVVRSAVEWTSALGAATEASLTMVIGQPRSLPFDSPGKSLDAVALATVPDPARRISLADPTSLLLNLADPIDHFPYRRSIGIYASRMADVLRLWTSVSPATPDVVIAGALPFLNAALAPGRSGATGLLDSIRPRGIPLGPIANTALALSLAAESSDTRLLAIDVMSEAIWDGRVAGPTLGAAIGELIRNRVVKVSRIAASLNETARIGPLAAHRVGEVIEHALPVALASDARDLHQLMATLNDSLSLHSSSIGTNATRAAVSAVANRKGRTKLTIEARRLIELRAGDPTTASQSAAFDAVHGRLSRVNDDPVVAARSHTSEARASPPRRRIFSRGKS